MSGPSVRAAAEALTDAIADATEGHAITDAFTAFADAILDAARESATLTERQRRILVAADAHRDDYAAAAAAGFPKGLPYASRERLIALVLVPDSEVQT